MYSYNNIMKSPLFSIREMKEKKGLQDRTGTRHLNFGSNVIGADLLLDYLTIEMIWFLVIKKESVIYFRFRFLSDLVGVSSRSNPREHFRLGVRVLFLRGVSSGV